MTLCCECIEPNMSIDDGTLLVKKLFHDIIIPYCLVATPPLTLCALRAQANTGHAHVVLHHVVVRTADNAAPAQVKQPSCGGQRHRHTMLAYSPY